MSDILIYSIILAIALSCDLFYIAMGTGMTMKPYSIFLHLESIIIFGVIITFMAFLGFTTGALLTDFIPDFSVYVGHSITAFVGIKFILETNKFKDGDRNYSISKIRILFALSLGASINIFLAYLGFGLIEHFMFKPVIILSAIVVGVVLFGTILGAIFKSNAFGRYMKLFGGTLMLLVSLYLIFQ